MSALLETIDFMFPRLLKRNLNRNFDDYIVKLIIHFKNWTTSVLWGHFPIIIHLHISVVWQISSR